MSTIILISSSPPRLFARSPTPAAPSSPALPSPGAILRGDTEGRKRFKTTPIWRDGFAGGFTSAAGLLRTGIGRENLPIASRDKIKDAAVVEISEQSQHASKHTESILFPAAQVPRPAANERQQSQAGSDQGYGPGKPQQSNPITERTGKSDRIASPLLLDKAPSRRLDWTPPSASSALERCSPSSPSRSFPGGLLGSFGYRPSDPKDCFGAQNCEGNGPSKRRRLDLVSADTSAASASAPDLSGKNPGKASLPAKKRTASPKKKYTTITALATSHYRESELGQGKAPLMQQYLTKSQTRLVEDAEEKATDTVKAKTKPKRAPTKKKAKSKVKVLSPRSAMKAFDSQEMMFGSASQLARDESPSLVCDTLEAVKQSESFSMSDPALTQMTQPISIESTPPRAFCGTARFTRKRNLWSAAGRDEENALLHVDTVDLFDTSDLRYAFAGKDVLLQSEAPRQRWSKSPEMRSLSIPARQPPASRASLYACYDIDDITTPVAHKPPANPTVGQLRTLHTTTNKNASRDDSAPKVSQTPNKDSTIPDVLQAMSLTSQAKAGSKPNLKKPLYAGFATHELQKQISAYGFKPIKKREKMIEILERCWEDKHGPVIDMSAGPTSSSALAASVESLTHGDFLSNVHDISSRPAPKAKQPKAAGRPKKDVADMAAKANPAKSPKKKEKAVPKANVGTRVPRQGKSKGAAAFDEGIVDIDDIEASISVTPMAAPPADSSLRAKLSTRDAPQPLPAPPPPAHLGVSSTSPALQPTLVLPALEATLTNAAPSPATLSSPLPPPDMASQITRAVVSYTAPKGHDHHRNPTWHEKILLFDPIVLEDLAAWLNTEGLGLIGEDREVSVLEVRSWCESRGICCLWKGGWKGNKANQGEED